MSKETVSRVFEAEKSADYAEVRARSRADEIIENAKNQAREYYAREVNSAQKESVCRLEKTKQEGDALIFSMEEEAKKQSAQLEQLADLKLQDAIKRIIDEII